MQGLSGACFTCGFGDMIIVVDSVVFKSDVYDHMEYALTSLDMFSGISENLIDYAFNVSFLSPPPRIVAMMVLRLL